MKAAYIRQTGSPDVIQYGDLPDPEPAEGEVLVKMAAAAVNPVDTYIRNGANYWPLPDPFIIGCDIAGVVASVGPGCRRFREGDRVWGTNQGLMGRQGVFAELAAIHEDWLYPTPEDVADTAAAACALVGVTAHLGLFQRARLQAGETVLVKGGAGGVGSMVLQMAKASGARVIATAGGEQKAETCRRLGADHVINYRDQSIPDAALEFAPNGVDVYWETMREPDFDGIVPVVAENGRIVLMAGRDARPAFPVGPFYVKGCSLHGFVMFKASPDQLRSCSADINRWLADGSLQAQIGCTLPLSESARAHQVQEDNTLHGRGELLGKVVVTP